MGSIVLRFDGAGAVELYPQTHPPGRESAQTQRRLMGGKGLSIVTADGLGHTDSMNPKSYRVAAAFLLIAFALVCLIFFRPSILALARFRVFPEDQLKAILIIIAVWHLAWGTALLFDFIPRAVTWASLAALMAYAVVAGVALSKGVDVSCGCIKNHLVLTGYVLPTLVIGAVEIMPLSYGLLFRAKRSLD